MVLHFDHKDDKNRAVRKGDRQIQMARKNYFEILHLSFDPAESRQRVIDKAVEDWKKRLEDQLGRESDPAKRRVLQDELALEADMKAVMGSPKTRNPEAAAMKKEMTGRLEALIDIMKENASGTPVVTMGWVRSVSIRLSLSQGTVGDVFTQKGFEVQQSGRKADMARMFLGKGVMDKLTNTAAILRAMQKGHEKFYPWLGKLYSLYDLAFFFDEGHKGPQADYSRLRTEELKALMDAGSLRYASDNSDIGHGLADLFSIGAAQIFKSEETRRMYDMSLRREELSGYFSKLREAPEAFLHERLFAESCIRAIQRRFPDYDLALALYNEAAGLANDPYEPMEAKIHLTCGSCGTPSAYDTKEAAQKAVCPGCGAPMYIKCPSCQKIVPSGTEYCQCGFRIFEMRFFEEYRDGALFALQEMDLAEAKRLAQKAAQANPAHPDLPGLQAKVKEAAARFQKPLDELRRLMDVGLYQKAKQFLDSTAAAMPQLKLDAQRKKIAQMLESAARRMPGTADLSPEAANACTDILDEVRDFGPAIERLRLIPPRKPLSLVTAASRSGSCSLSWRGAPDRGVSYRLVRKEGGVPASPSDGAVLEEELKKLEYTDSGVRPGIGYGYAVFAVRQGVFSEGAFAEFVVYTELDEKMTQFSAGDGHCSFRWVLPANAVGVRILRAQNVIPGQEPGAGTVVAAAQAVGEFTDRGLANGKAYGYRLQCVYPWKGGVRYSAGITKQLIPEPLPMAVRGAKAVCRGTTVTVTWQDPDGKGRRVLIREVKDEGAKAMTGQVLSEPQISAALGSTKVFAQAVSSDGSAVFTIPVNSSVRLAVVTQSGTSGIIGAVLGASSVEKIEIDREMTRVEGNRLVIRLKKVPDSVRRIHYLCASKTDPSRVPWAGPADIGKGQMRTVTAEKFRQDGVITVEYVPQEDLYLSVIGEAVLPSGEQIFAEPALMRICNAPKRVISYRMTWAAGGFPRRRQPRGAMLRIRVHGSGGEDIPEMKLVCRTDGHIPMSTEGPLIRVLHTVPACEGGGTEYSYRFEDSTWASYRGLEARLMIAPEDRMEFELQCEDLASLRIP